MRRIAPVALSALVLLLPATAAATITPTRDPALVVGALAMRARPARSPRPPSGDPRGRGPARGRRRDAVLAGFPIDGTTYAILTTGDAALADTANGR